MPSKSLNLPQDASDVFDKGNKHAVDNGMVLIYGLQNTTKTMIQKSCDRATKSYARQALN